MIQPTQAQLDAGFAAGKTKIDAMVDRLVPSWARSMVNITDDEIYEVSDAIVQAALNATEPKP